MLSVAIEVLTVQITQYVVDVYIRLRDSCRCVAFLFIGPVSFLHQWESEVDRNLKYKTTELTVFVLRASCSRGQSERRVDSTWNASPGHVCTDRLEKEQGQREFNYNRRAMVK